MALGQIIKGISNEQVFADIWTILTGQFGGNDPDGSRFKSPNRFTRIENAVGKVAVAGSPIKPGDHIAVTVDQVS